MGATTLRLAEDDARGRGHFVLRRLHSLSGALPLGAFLVEHLWTNARALAGEESFNEAVGGLQSIPALGVIEVLGILAPLLFHAVYGVVIAAQGRPNVQRYGYARNWLYLLQRLSGVAALVFVAVHLVQYRVPKLLGRVPWEDFYGLLLRDLSRPGLFALYFIGITATVFHFANGLWLAGNTWGLTASAKSQRTSARACAVFGLALWALGMNTLVHFGARCGGALPAGASSAVERACRGPDQPMIRAARH